MLVGKGILSPLQKDFLNLFAEIHDQEYFYLTGGTALSEYYLGHRLSFDLDLFTSDADIILPFSYRVEQAIESKGLQVAVIRRFASFVELQITRAGDSLKVDFGLDSPYRFAPVEPGDSGVLVNDFRDIQADKTLAFFGRAEPRDAIDVYFLLQKTNIEILADLAHQKDPGFDMYWLAVALNRTANLPDELERWPVKMLVNCDPVDLKLSFQKIATEIMTKYTAQD
jgi:Nucleotidyl transferase AbiEii toxin, Type IV TA system